MKEIIVYLLLAVSSQIMLGYSIHMLVGGLVSEQVETFLIASTCIVALVIMAYMTWDVVQRRRGLK